MAHTWDRQRPLRQDVFPRGHPRTLSLPIMFVLSASKRLAKSTGYRRSFSGPSQRLKAISTPSAVNYNKNGSFDYGLMQVNSSWYGELGYERWTRLGDACYNVQVGAWILSQCIQRYGYSWVAVGCYNGVSKDKRAAYANSVYQALKIPVRSNRFPASLSPAR